jgi:hypothetical protein
LLVERRIRLWPRSRNFRAAGFAKRPKAATAGWNLLVDAGRMYGAVCLGRSQVTTAAKLLARKQQLLERLQQDPRQHERDEIERLLADIDAALNLLERAGPTVAES